MPNCDYLWCLIVMIFYAWLWWFVMPDCDNLWWFVMPDCDDFVCLIVMIFMPDCDDLWWFTMIFLKPDFDYLFCWLWWFMMSGDTGNRLWWYATYVMSRKRCDDLWCRGDVVMICDVEKTLWRFVMPRGHCDVEDYFVVIAWLPQWIYIYKLISINSSMYSTKTVSNKV